jgi:hydroxymethylglutaryl-CoA reductase
MTMMARKRSMANYPGVRQFCLESNLCGELSLGSAIVAGEWVGAHERLGRNRPALRGFNSEKEASWTG